jgi:hypothetical protein
VIDEKPVRGGDGILSHSALHDSWSPTASWPPLSKHPCWALELAALLCAGKALEPA